MTHRFAPLLLIVAAVLIAAPAAAATHCLDVDARRGWQYLPMPDSFMIDWYFDADWTVDARSYSPVGVEGHRGADAAALELTGNPDTFVEMMLGLAEANLSDPSPPEWSVALWFTHPPVGQRVGRALQS